MLGKITNTTLIRDSQSHHRKIGMIEDSEGFSLVEVIVSMTVLTICALAFLSLYVTLQSTARASKFRSVALSLATSKVEKIKLLPYDALAVVGGSITAPTLLPNTEDITVDGYVYTVNLDIDYVDDAYDGCANYVNATVKAELCRNLPEPTGATVDTNPKDYKAIDVTVIQKNGGSKLAKVSTNISARVSETNSTTGAVYVTVVDSSGNPVSGALINVVNTTITPNVNQSDTTDAGGVAVFYDLTPDTTNYDYTITASKSGYSTLTTIPVSGSLYPTFPSQQVLTQQSTLVTMIINQQGANSLLLEAVNTAGTALSNMKIYTKGGYKKYTNSTNTAYYFDNLSPSDTRPTTDASGLTSIQNLSPNPYFFCGDLGATSCTVGGTTYYLVAALPYIGSNPYYPIAVPSYDPIYPPATVFAYGGNNYIQKVKLVLTTTSSFPRIQTLSPSEISQSGGGLGSFAFQITGINLPCSNVAASCGTTVKIKSTSGSYTASCTGTTGTTLNCTVNLSGIIIGQTQLEVTSSGNTYLSPTGVLGGINVVP